MLTFYKDTVKSFLALFITTLLLSYACISSIDTHTPLLPLYSSEYPWVVETGTDARNGGSSTLSVNQASTELDYDFTITHGVDHPYATVELVFVDKDQAEQHVDLSKFSSLSFDILCSPSNTLNFGLKTFNENIEAINDPESYRIPSDYLSCRKTWTRVNIDLQHLIIPDWWLTYHGLDLSNEEYFIDKVMGMTFGISSQSLFDTPSNVKIKALSLNGQSYLFVYILAAIIFPAWFMYLYWVFRQHTKALILDLRESLNNDRPLIAYQQLTMEPQKDKDKSALLRLMAMEYAKPELSLEYMSTTLGLNRTKINEILKEELGLTFSVYLNKLRLTESARLLLEREEVSVSEIAYSVGYNNVPYFNKLFKSKYGCTPKKFKTVSHSQSLE